MNYRHAYHAGNYADVFKHALLVLLIETLKQKDKPFVYIDTHAGNGRYDLTGVEAQKNGEYRDGIGRLWDVAEAPAELATYLGLVRALNPDGVLRHYPGSPAIAGALLRAHDRMILAEVEPAACAQLHDAFNSTPRVRIHGEDGYAGLKAWVPPRERRGLVLVDPPYERDSDWERVVTAIAGAWAKWPTGVYAAWYPVKHGAPTVRLRRAFQQSAMRSVLALEFCAHARDTPFRLNGGGMVVINPPWRFEEQAIALLPVLRASLAQSPRAETRSDWLVTE